MKLTDEQIARALDADAGVAECWQPTSYSSFELRIFRAGMREAAKIAYEADESIAGKLIYAAAGGEG